MSSPDFAALGVAAPILKAVNSLGYEQPTPIQTQSIPLLLAGKNLLGTAQTGTGKTAAFALPLLSRLDHAQKSPQVLVLTPTRELAIQVAEAFQSYGRNLSAFHVLPVYGGQDMGGQLRALKRGVQVVVGTPGRIMDHLRRRSLNLRELRAVVLDEADEMLRMGFIDDVETILAETPAQAQRALFSATMPAAIRRIASNYLGDAEEIQIAAKTKTVERISQSYLMVQNNQQKLDALTRILEVETFDGMIVFVRTKSTTVELAEKLEARGFAAAALNGDLSQQLRERTVGRLKKGQLDILVATDVAARGLDVERISHVVNYDIPYDNESYVHRIGRTGRAGREGKAILFVTPKERRLLRSIEHSTRQSIDSMALPTGEQVSDQRVGQFQARILETLEGEDLQKFRDLLQAMAHENNLSMADIAAALAWQLQRERPLFPKLREPAPSAKRADKSKPEKTRQKLRQPDHDAAVRPQESAKSRDQGRAQEKAGRRAQPDYPIETYRLEVGHSHGVQPADIVGAIANEAEIDSQYIGRIQIHDDYSTVDLPEGMPKELFQYLRKVRICQQPIRLSLVAENRPAKSRKKPPASRGRSGGKKSR